ncbi:MAG: hypothetical protein ISQ06_04490 [Planctomycetaceae bacterium]|nr:hypothetical protein [Planctomycetaceae bacterium]
MSQWELGFVICRAAHPIWRPTDVPVELVFSKLKKLLRDGAERTVSPAHHKRFLVR